MKYPNILLWGNNVFIKIDSNDDNIAPKYLQASISGYVFGKCPMTYEEVMNYSNSRAVHVNSLLDINNAYNTSK